MVNTGPDIVDKKSPFFMKFWILILSVVCILLSISTFILFKQTVALRNECNELLSQIASIEENIDKLSSQKSDANSIPQDILGIHTRDKMKLSSDIEDLKRVCKSIYHERKKHDSALAYCTKCSEIFDKGYTWLIE